MILLTGTAFSESIMCLIENIKALEGNSSARYYMTEASDTGYNSR